MLQIYREGQQQGRERCVHTEECLLINSFFFFENLLPAPHHLPCDVPWWQPLLELSLGVYLDGLLVYSLYSHFTSGVKWIYRNSLDGQIKVFFHNIYLDSFWHLSLLWFYLLFLKSNEKQFISQATHFRIFYKFVQSNVLCFLIL